MKHVFVDQQVFLHLEVRLLTHHVTVTRKLMLTSTLGSANMLGWKSARPRLLKLSTLFQDYFTLVGLLETRSVPDCR